jgi:hypothetical protein
MNKQVILSWLLKEAEEHESLYQPRTNLKEALKELNNRREVALPASIPSTPEEAIPLLRKHFKDNVTLVSLVLNHHFPKDYLFYRVSRLEEEIFEGLNFLAEIVPDLDLSFSRVGRRGFERYLRLNAALLSFARAHWPGLGNPQVRLAAFLYQGLGLLFLHKSEYNRYWIAATRQDHFHELDEKKTITWSGRKEMKQGDLVFMYRTAPRKAITDLCRVEAKDSPEPLGRKRKKRPFDRLLGTAEETLRREADTRFDLWGAWDGFWVVLRRVCQIDGIPFAIMRHDPVLSKWGTVRKQFMGTVIEPIPHSIYNRLLDMLPRAVRVQHRLEPEPVANLGRSGEFTSEAKFEEKVIAPLLERWGFKYQTQYPCHFRFGSQDHHGRVDFFVSDERGPLTLFEDKLRIHNEDHLQPAIAQAKSYALMLGLPSFVVAAPEGLWLYSLRRNLTQLELHVPGDELALHEEELRSQILQLRQSGVG